MGIACSNSNQTTANQITVDNAANGSADEIINGAEIQLNDPVAQSTIGIFDSLTRRTCSGVLIDKNIVLTAAHCSLTEAKYLYIVFTTNFNLLDAAHTRTYQTRQVIRSAVSPDWRNNQFNIKDQGDVALLLFTGDLPAGYKPSPMLLNSQALTRGLPTVIAGYGISDVRNYNTARILRKAVVTIDNPNFSKSEISVDQSKGYGACIGDSGGPAFVFINGQYFVLGIINRGFNETDQNRCRVSGIFSTTVFYGNWIQSTARQLLTGSATPTRR